MTSRSFFLNLILRTVLAAGVFGFAGGPVCAQSHSPYAPSARSASPVNGKIRLQQGFPQQHILPSSHRIGHSRDPASPTGGHSLRTSAPGNSAPTEIRELPNHIPHQRYVPGSRTVGRQFPPQQRFSKPGAIKPVAAAGEGEAVTAQNWGIFDYLTGERRGQPTAPPPALTVPTQPPSDVAPTPDRTAIPDALPTSQDLVTLVVRNQSLGVVLSLIAEQHGLNVVAGDEVSGSISVTLNGVPLDDALHTILTANGYTWTRQRNILLVSRIAPDTQLSAVAQGRVLRVFRLNYAAAADVDAVVQGLLSPVGQSFVTETDSLDTRRTREELVVEDLPEYLARIESYVAQADRPPQQVLVEAHILEVDLRDETKHGVNFEQLLRLSNARVTLSSVGFANPDASPAFFLGIDGTDLDGLLEALKTTTDAKTLASPKVLVLNGQEARIQIGSSFGYFVTTTTQTSTLQNVNFLDVGVVLSVTPFISDESRILMNVRPEVSGGRINPDTGLPDKDTTELQTTIMLRDGQGMVIGGLLQEEDTEIQSKIPIAGDLWLVGRAFQRRTVIRDRKEIVIALIPRILPYSGDACGREVMQLEQATTPLLDGPLRRVDRRMWEPELPDAMRDPRSIRLDRIPDAVHNFKEDYPNPPEYYFPSISEEESGVYGPYGFQRLPSQSTTE